MKFTIQTQEAYRGALALASALIVTDPEKGTADADLLIAIVTLIEEYECRHFPSLARVA